MFSNLQRSFFHRHFFFFFFCQNFITWYYKVFDHFDRMLLFMVVTSMTSCDILETVEYTVRKMRMIERLWTVNVLYIRHQVWKLKKKKLRYRNLYDSIDRYFFLSVRVKLCLTRIKPISSQVPRIAIADRSSLTKFNEFHSNIR